jgi:hypothetical protein
MTNKANGNADAGESEKPSAATGARVVRRRCDANEPWTAAFRTELAIVVNRLSFGRFKADALDERCDAWEEHVNCFRRIAKEPSGKTDDIRIQFLVKHLDTVDDKFGKILQFQALVLAGITVGLGSLWQHYERLKAPPFPQGWWLPVLVDFIFWFAYGCWCLSTLLCFWGIRRVLWGDLGKHSAQHELTEQEHAPEPEETAEQEHVKELICEVIKRTAKFRVAVPLTVTSVILLALLPPILFLSPILSKPRSVRLAGQGGPVAYGEHIADVGPFPPGAGCGNSNRMIAEMKNAAATIRDNRVRKVLVEGSADAVPIGASLAELYGNNTGLALSRARCVAGWLSQSLAAQGAHVEIVIGVRDAVGRTPHHLHFGNGEDREVAIDSLPDGTRPQ